MVPGVGVGLGWVEGLGDGFGDVFGLGVGDLTALALGDGVRRMVVGDGPIEANAMGGADVTSDALALGSADVVRDGSGLAPRFRPAFLLVHPAMASTTATLATAVTVGVLMSYAFTVSVPCMDEWILQMMS